MSSISIACLGATLRDSATIGEEQNRPMLTPGVAKVAAVEAIARSQVATSWHPAALAAPCTAAMTGFGRLRTACIMVRQRSHTVLKKARPPSASARRAVSSLRSCPAQNAGPLAAMTTARIAGSAAIVARAAVIASSISSERLLRAAGRFSVSTAMPSTVSRSSTASTDGTVITEGAFT